MRRRFLSKKSTQESKYRNKKHWVIIIPSFILQSEENIKNFLSLYVYDEDCELSPSGQPGIQQIGLLWKSIFQMYFSLRIYVQAKLKEIIDSFIQQLTKERKKDWDSIGKLSSFRSFFSLVDRFDLKIFFILAR